jgi:hypothetical protein
MHPEIKSSQKPASPAATLSVEKEHEEGSIHRRVDHLLIERGGERYSGRGALPLPIDQNRDVP